MLKNSWLSIGGGQYRCFRCGYIIFTDGSWEYPNFKYCPECGIRLCYFGEIDQNMWDIAVEHIRIILNRAAKCSKAENIYYKIQCEHMLNRYYCDDRSHELYNAMLEIKIIDIFKERV